MKNNLLCTTAVALCLSLAPASAQQAITTPILTSAANFRDLAGIAASVNGQSTGANGLADTTSNNGVMRTGVFYRSQTLDSLSPGDSQTITNLNVRHDIDLRTPQEYDPTWTPPPPGNPDVVPNGATLVHINIYGTPQVPPTSTITDEAGAIAYMKGTYEGFVADHIQRAALHDVLIFLANVSDPALYHCSGGKDRTGWTSMLLQTIAGVPLATIQQDYLATNLYTKTFIDQQTAVLVALHKEYLIPMLGVDLSYLQAGLDQLTASGYASIYAYLTQGLGLTQADIYVLRAKMVYFSGSSGNRVDDLRGS